MEQLQDIIAEEWEVTPRDLLARLVESMPARCQAVIDAKGEQSTELVLTDLEKRKTTTFGNTWRSTLLPVPVPVLEVR
jgi:hypothetical protein